MSSEVIKAPAGLVGRFFHTCDERGRTHWQGKFIADLQDGYYLLQLFEWFAGDPTTQHVFHLRDIAAKHENGIIKFRIYDDVKHAQWYLKTWQAKRDERIDAEARNEPSGNAG